MIFDSSDICTCGFCNEYESQTVAVNLPFADLVIILINEKSAAASVADEDVLLTGEGCVLIAHGHVQISPAPECDFLAIGLNGIAPQNAAKNVQIPIITNTSVCIRASTAAKRVLNAENKNKQRQSENAYQLLCALENADADYKIQTLPVLVSQSIIEMQKNFAHLYGIEELSTQLGVSKNHLVRVFTANIGVSPGSYLTNIKIEAAKQLLISREYNLEIISSLCGFSCSNYFCKVFRKQVGITPTAYREKEKAVILPENTVISDLEHSLYV